MLAAGTWNTKARMPGLRAGRWIPLSTWLAWLSIVPAFAMSPLMMDMLGFSYETPGGSPIEKIAPSTWICFLSLFALAWERGPAWLLDDIVRRHKLTIVFGFAWLIQLIYIVWRGGVLTSTVDTFVLPIVLLFVLTRQSARDQRATAQLIHIFMAVNALLALFEFASGWRLTPIVIRELLIEDWRSTALLGQPLANAMATGCYALVLLVGGSRDLPPWCRLPALALQIAAMVAFGGRLASALLVLALALAGLRSGYRVLTGRRFSFTGVTILALSLPLVVLGIGYLVEAGAFDKFVSRFVSDDGSAQARIVMFDVLNSFRWDELLVGPDPELLFTRQRIYGTPFGIENFWLAMVLYYGILTCIPFFIALFCFVVDICRAARPQAWFVIAYFFAVCTGSLSLAGKTTMFGLMVAVIVVLLRPPALQTAIAADRDLARARARHRPADRAALGGFGRPGQSA